MSRNRAILAAVVVVAICAVVYFGILAKPPADGDVMGTIGAVQKYRAEQIGDDDVVLAGAAGGRTGEGTTDLFDRASMQEKAEFFERLPVLNQDNMYKRLEYSQQVEAFHRNPILKSEDTFVQFLEKTNATEIGLCLEKSPGWAQQIDATPYFEALPTSLKRDMLLRSPMWRTEEGMQIFYDATPKSARVATFGRSPESFIQLPLEQKIDVFNRVQPCESADFMNEAFGRLPVEKQADTFARKPIAKMPQAAEAFYAKMTATDFKIIFEAMPASERYESFKRSPLWKTELFLEPYFGALQKSEKAAAFERADGPERAMALERCTEREIDTMLQRTGLADQADYFYNAKPAEALAMFNALDDDTKLTMLKNLPASEIEAMLKKSELWQSELLLEDFFRNAPAQEKASVLARSPMWKNERFLQQFFGSMAKEDIGVLLENNPVWQDEMFLQSFFGSMSARDIGLMLEKTVAYQPPLSEEQFKGMTHREQLVTFQRLPRLEQEDLIMNSRVWKNEMFLVPFFEALGPHKGVPAGVPREHVGLGHRARPRAELRADPAQGRAGEKPRRGSA